MAPVSVRGRENAGEKAVGRGRLCVLRITCKLVDGRAEAATAKATNSSTVATAQLMRLVLLAFIVVTRRHGLNVNKTKMKSE